MTYEGLLGFLGAGYSSRAREAGLPAYTHTFVPPGAAAIPGTITIDVGQAARLPRLTWTLMTVWEPRVRYWRRTSPHMRVSCCRRRRPWRGDR